MSQVDLHLHTTASDGVFSPEDIVAKAARLGLRIIAICDHDTVDGISRALAAAKAFTGLRVIPGVEVSTDFPAGEVHVLGYFIDHTNKELGATLKRMRQTRRERAQGMIAKLDKLGIHIDWSRVQEIAGSGSIGRPHIAQAMLEKGYINSIGDAFYRYISKGGPAYVERIKMTPEEAVKLILRSGGLPVLAHPLTIDDPEAVTTRLKAVGLIGIEAYYGEFNAEQVSYLVKMAHRHNLIVTGGSDYHGLDDARETMIGGAQVPLEAAQKLIALAERPASKATSSILGSSHDC